MTQTTSMDRLRAFQAQSPLAAADPELRNDSIRRLLRGLEPEKPVRRKVGDLLTVVMALSARTRRMVQPRVAIDVDVFAPNGTRAVRLYLKED